MRALPGAALVLGVPLIFFARLFRSGLVLPIERFFFGRLFRGLRSTADTERHRDSIMLITPHY